MIDYDQTLLESTRTHRERLTAAFVHGEQRDRRIVNSNLRRLTGSVVLGAVLCAACLGTGFVLDILQTQREDRAVAAYRAAIAATPMEPGDGLTGQRGTASRTPSSTTGEGAASRGM